ncbi:MAG: disulfide bond formation protein B [Gammaproteobacteria bacterium]|nr:disulfide bond formation protein B [Gammaproteobacteria bacterium]
MTRTELLALSTLFLAGVIAAGAQFLEFVVGLDPCPLCLMQRLWVMIVGLLVCAALADNVHRGIYPLVIVSACLIGAGFSLRQLYLQSLPADAVPACGPDLAYMIDVLPFADTLRAMTFGTGSCATVDWSLFGLSLAGWALLGFAGLMLLTIGWWRTIRAAL